jgi:endonuclease III
MVFEMKRKSTEQKMSVILTRLKKRYRKEMKTSLGHTTPWELLVATMLSAQTTDAQVNKVTPALFKRYPEPKDYVKLKSSQLYRYTRSLNIYRNKSKYIIKSAQYMQKIFNGKVPDTLEELIQLPGVGRKTANVVLANAFGKNEGIAIDTHCITVANRLFLYHAKNAAQIEEHLIEIVPKTDWGNVNHLFIALGRDVCTARRRYCEECVLKDICPSSTIK